MARTITKSSATIPPWLRLLREKLGLAQTRISRHAHREGTSSHHETELYYFLRQATSYLRWGAIILLFVLTLLEPTVGRVGLANWQLILLFIAYNIALELFLYRLFGSNSVILYVMLDLPVAGFIYLCSAHPNSPQSVLLFLAVICAAISMKLRASLLYTSIAVMLMCLIDTSFPWWQATADYQRQLGTDIIMLALVGIGTAILTWRLTMEQQHSQSARAATARLEELERRRSDFISNITHDLRTPFTAVQAGLGMVEMSMADRLRPNEQHLIGSVQRNIDRLGILINDLLALNQIEAGALRLNRQPIDLCLIMQNAIATIQPLVDEKGQILSVRLPGPLVHEGDARRLEQVFVNLLDNAHHHTLGGTHIYVTGYIHGSEVVMVVSDEGPGIPPQERDSIFQRFYRLTPSDGGWGLGLAIAQTIVELHDGRIWVESEPGMGCAFHVALPAVSYQPSVVSDETDS